MVILHYAGVSKNNASGVSVIVPKIMNVQTKFAKIGFFNYGTECFDMVEDVVNLSKHYKNDDYHFFPQPFSRPDIVVFHSPFGILKSMRIARMLKSEGIPYVVVPHGCFSRFAMRKKVLKKTIARFICIDKFVRNAEYIQYLSEGEKISSIYNSKNFIVPNGIDILEYVEKETREKLRITFIGRKDCYHKGLDFLINACGIAKNELKNKIELHIYGPALNAKKSKVKELILKNGVEDFVFDCPPIFGEEKKKVLLNTDIFVLTSRFEGQPVAILEAWASGVATLVTPGTNVADECDKNKCGWSVDFNVKAIAEKMVFLVNNREEIEKNSKKAQCYVQEKYSWENISNMYFAEYEKIANKNKV